MYVPADVNFLDDPRIIGLSLGAVGMYMSAACIAEWDGDIGLFETDT